MYIIPINNLEKGDIILTSENSATSKVVRKGTGSNFSHAILYVGSESYIHSDANGVHSGNLQRLLFDSPKNVTVLRANCNLQKFDQICIFARSKIGTKYSVKSAINAKLKLSKKENSNRQFCSRLVAQAYHYGGVELVETPSFCSPQEILESKYVYEVLGVVRRASIEEIECANSENPIEKQARITNEILANIRDISGNDIQTFSQVDKFVIDNPQYDNQISNIYNASGYLTMWSYEIEKNPWRYDGEIFINSSIPKDELLKIAERERYTAIEILQRLEINFQHYYSFNETHQLEYSKINLELYKKLIENTNKSIIAAEHVLNNI